MIEKLRSVLIRLQRGVRQRHKIEVEVELLKILREDVIELINIYTNQLGENAAIEQIYKKELDKLNALLRDA
jgi:hypothetical protein